MLSKINRIKKKKDFDEIFKKGASFKNSLLVLRVVKNNMGQNRFGIVVSQKVSKKAVARNKVRRRISETLRAELSNMKISADAVFIALLGIEKKEFLDVKEAVKELLLKSKIINV